MVPIMYLFINRHIALLSMSVAYNAVAIVRNEEQHIKETIRTIKKQDLPANRVIIVDDGSTDRTSQILQNIDGIEVITNPPHEDSYLGSPKLTMVRHQGRIVAMRDRIDYLLEMDGDIRLPHNYCREMIARMPSDNAVIASGVFPGERLVMPHDAGRVINATWFSQIGDTHIEQHGNETWPLFKAYTMGFNTATYHDLCMHTTRRTGANYATQWAYNNGRGRKALGFSWYYTLWRFMRVRNKKSLALYHGMRGYFTKTELFEPEIRAWVRKYQKDRIRCELLCKKSLLQKQNKTSIVIGDNI